MIAATFGAINDALKASGSPAELGFANHGLSLTLSILNSRASRTTEYLAPFLQAMKKLADQQRANSAA